MTGPFRFLALTVDVERRSTWKVVELSHSTWIAKIEVTVAAIIVQKT